MFKGWKTISFNIVAALVPVLELTELLPLIPEDYMPYYMFGVALANLFLRTVTTTPVFAKETVKK
tara:strand:- start:97 stop:291 length:195 start_codon:yes stop_codon:yes gene_type:complete